MKLKTTTGLLLISAVLVAGCRTTTGEDAPTFDEMTASAAALEVLYGGEAARTDVPVAGAATFEGYVGGDLDDGRELIGELDLNANFGTGDVTGSATNFSDDGDQGFTGTLDFVGDVIYAPIGNADSLEGFLTGDLSADGETYDTSILLDGSEFYGGTGAELPDAVAGDASGFLDDGGLGLLFDGTFIAERP